MKNFRKNKQDFFICEECNRTFLTINALRIHIQRSHNTKLYHDKWIKEENEGTCKICGKDVNFFGVMAGYKNCCSKKCTNLYRYEKNKLFNINKFGCENNFQRKDCKEKIKITNKKLYNHENAAHGSNEYKVKETMIERYGFEHALQNKDILEKVHNTMEKRYGYEHALQNTEIKNKFIKTCNEKFGVDCPYLSEKCKEKSIKTKIEKYNNKNYNNREKCKETCIERYGCENVSQNKEINDKKLKSSFTKNKFQNTVIYYQGSYELDFLEKYYDKYSDIVRGPSIKYVFKKKKKVYHSDFYIPSLNLVVECKNSYLAKRDKQIIKAKKKATIHAGYKYIMIVNKNYKIFLRLFQ